MHHHTTYRVLQCALWMFTFQGLAQGGLFQAARILAVAIVDLLIQTAARHRDLISVDYNHKIATRQMRREGWFMLAAQNLRDL